MPEIKHTFTAGRMNKDLDLRLVQNGEYRDAQNIQVRTTDADGTSVDGDAGTVQNLKGNQDIGSFTEGDTHTVCVGSITDEKSDKAYFFFTKGEGTEEQYTSQLASGSTEYKFIDCIAEQDVISNNLVPVVVDVHTIFNTFESVMGSSPTLPSTTDPWNQLTVQATVGANLRVGMSISLINDNDVLISNAIIQSINSAANVITLTDYITLNLSGNQANSVFKFASEKVLNFNKQRIISSINILDKFLFYTDGINEPKKININRCKEGSPTFDTQTSLVLNDPINPNETLALSTLEPVINTSDLKKEHITVIRKAPTQPPTVDVSNRALNSLSIQLDGFVFEQDVLYADEVDNSFNPLEVGNQILVEDSEFSSTNFLPGDTLIFTSAADSSLQVECSFISYIDTSTNITDSNTTGDVVQSVDIQTTAPSNTINIEIVEFLGDVFPGPNDNTWLVNTQAKKDKTLFELKFVRFAYRYRYDDGEYSTFSPFTNVVFEPGAFDYNVVKGFNLGMTNTALELKITDFIPHHTVRPLDVSSVDILMKTTNDANVYVVKTIHRGRDPEWSLFTPSSDSDDIQKTGELILTSEMIHNVISEEQLLRSFDNVPVKALAQEITASRLLYGNYSLGYNLKYSPSLFSSIISKAVLSTNFPKKSVKSLRDYKWGIVFGDKYGRETPVIASSYVSGDNNAGFLASTADVKVEKNFCKTANKFKIAQNWNNADENSSGQPEDWMEYVKYYVKETTNEYYNLILNRWYYAENKDNIWLSFSSADRNKLDEETYLILKSEHGTSSAVTEKARYKVIDIKNEAPEYIKRKFEIIETMTMPESGLYTSGSGNTSTQIPNRLSSIPDEVNFGVISSLIGTQLQGAFTTLDQSLRNEVDKGDKFLKITATAGGQTIELHDFIKITNFKSDGSNLNNRFVIDTKNTLPGFESGSSYIDAFTSAGVDLSGNDAITYNLVYAKLTIEDKPEFDGKFFVLIEKDDVISNRVEKTTGAIPVFTQGDVIPTAYLDCQTNNPGVNAGQGNTGDNNNSEYVFGSSALANQNFGSGEDQYNPVFLGGFSPDDSNIGSVFNVASADDARDFYQDLKDSLTGQRFFIDSSISVRFKWSTDDDSLFSYKQTGIDQGSASNGTLGRICITQLAEAGPGMGDFTWQSLNTLEVSDDVFSYLSGSDNPFELALFSAEAGADKYFKFSNDPNNETYKIVTIDPDTEAELPIERGIGYSFIANEAGSSNTTVPFNFETEDTISLNGEYTRATLIGTVNYGYGVDGNLKRSIRFEFRRVDKNTGQVTNEGIDPSVYDPRATLRHDGSQELNIILVEKITDNGEIIVPDSNKAIFETEPKEDLDLELYYEASQGLPLILKENNLFNYIPPNCEIEIERGYKNDIRIVKPTIVPTALPFDVYQPADVHVESINNQGQTASGPLVRLRAIDNAGDEVDQKHNIGVGDFIRFIHPNGTITKSLVTAFKNSNGTDVTVRERTLSLIDDSEGQVSIGVLAGNSEGLNDNQATSNINSGMQVQGTYTASDSTTGDIPSGTFIFNYFGQQDNMYLTNVSWMESGLTYTVNIIESTGYYEIDRNVYKYPVELGWHNCYVFGNGVESDRIRDDFNTPQIDNGVKVSSTVSNIKREQRPSGLIYSGIYNSNSSTNKLNQFNISQKITKDLNPDYGSVQALKTRDADVVVLTEDKILKVLSNKDAVFNADGNPQLTATNRVLGQSIPFSGNYGISKNPESLASDRYRLYFTDKQRGAVLRLSKDGLTPISSVGMKNYFRKTLRNATSAVGSFDAVNEEYNLTIKTSNNSETISFNESSKGWISFKSFIPTQGVSLSGKYLTTFENKVYEHYSDTADRNTFYNQYSNSSINVIFNDIPSSVKSFKSINYEGSQARVNEFATETDNNGVEYTDGEYFNLEEKPGWFVDTITTDLDTGSVNDFKKKENKWFNRLKGVDSGVLNTENFQVQGLGFSLVNPQDQLSDDIDQADNDNSGIITGVPVQLTIQNDPNS